MKKMIARRPLVAFFVLAYAGSWLVWSPWWVLSQSGLGVLSFQLPPGVGQLIQLAGLLAGPFAAALIVTRVVDGTVRPLLRRVLQWRERPASYFLALAAIPLALAGAVLAWPAGEASGQQVPGGVGLVVNLVVVYLICLVGGALEEEPGWRGFALPRLQQHLHPTTAAIVLGFLWCGWHAPQFFTAEWDTPRSSVADLAAYLVFVVATSVVLSWVTNTAKGSIMLAILAHTSVNFTLTALPLFTGRDLSSLWPATTGIGALAILAIVITRGRLGHRTADSPEANPSTGPTRPPERVLPLLTRSIDG